MGNAQGHVWVVFADEYDRRERREDLICHSQGEAKRHSKDLAKMGCEPVTKVFDSEDAFYAWQEKAKG